MNAVYLKPGNAVSETVDQLIANYGLRAVLLAVSARLLKRSRPPDTVADLAVRGQPELDLMDDRLRADIGLAPKPAQNPHVLLGVAIHRSHNTPHW